MRFDPANQPLGHIGTRDSDLSERSFVVPNESNSARGKVRCSGKSAPHGDIDLTAPEQGKPAMDQERVAVSTVVSRQDERVSFGSNKTGSRVPFDIVHTNNEKVPKDDWEDKSAVSTNPDTFSDDSNNFERIQNGDLFHRKDPINLHGGAPRASKRRSSSAKSIFNIIQSDEFIQIRNSVFSIIQPNDLIRAWKSTESLKFEKVESFFFNNGMTVALGGLFLSLNIIVAAHAACQFTKIGGFTTDNDILRITLPIARAGGRLVTFNCAWLLLTGCKYTWTMIRTHVVPVIPIGFPIDDIMPKYPRFVALWIIFFGCGVHSLPQMVNYATGVIKMDGRRNLETRSDEFSSERSMSSLGDSKPIDEGLDFRKLTPLSHEVSKVESFGAGMATKQLFITGCMLLLIFTMFYLTTLKAFRKTATGFRWFWVFHMGGIALAYPLLIVHGTFKGRPIFLVSALAPMALYLFDVLMRRCAKNTTTKILEWKTHSEGGDQITELILECPPNFVHTPGQYAELKFNPLSSHEWHPFTIASAPNNAIRVYNGKEVKVIVFVIKAVGRWTEALYNYASAFDLSKATKDMEISIRGPHGSPCSNMFEYKHIIVIGSGVGVAPLMSVWQSMVDQGRSRIEENQSFRRNSSIATAPSTSMKHSASPVERRNTLRAAKIRKLRLMCSKAESFMDSLTISICLYAFFLTGETIVAVTQICGHYLEVAAMEIVFASMSLMVHVGSMIVSITAQESGMRYFRLPKSWIELGITFVDVLNLWLSISVVRLTSAQMQPNSTSPIVGLGGVAVLLYAIRIFHIFYTTLKPETKTIKATRQSQFGKVSSIQGIFVNRTYTGMRYCLEELLAPLDEEGLSRVFSLQFYGTRETVNSNSENNSINSSLVVPDGIEDEISVTEADVLAVTKSLSETSSTGSLFSEESGEHWSRERTTKAGLNIRNSAFVVPDSFETEIYDETETTAALDWSLNESSPITHASIVSSSSQSEYCSFHRGRPDWESIFEDAIDKAHNDHSSGNPNGESIGVFFCGSPAIAKCLRATADKVNARHQFTAKRSKKRSCKCKIVVHVEAY